MARPPSEERTFAVGSTTLGLWAVAGWIPPILNVILLLTGIVLIGLILIQKGKGGGLAGAFGGAGGSSAFGSRAGDTFTRITIWAAAIWLLLIMILIKTTQPTTPLPVPGGEVEQGAPAGPAVPPAE